MSAPSVLFADVTLPFKTNLEAAVKRAVTSQAGLGHFPFGVEGFDQRVLELLGQHGLFISHYEVFFTPAHHFLAIHVDGPTVSNIVKLNWVFGGEGSKMMWWKLKSGCEMVKGTTPLNTPYLYIAQKDAVMIGMKSIGQPTLVNVGQPHSVLNATARPRWCLSAVLTSKETGLNIQMDEALEALGMYVSKP